MNVPNDVNAPNDLNERAAAVHEMRAERDSGETGAAGRGALLWHVMSTDEPRTMCGRTLARPQAAVPPDPDLSDADRYCADCMAAC